ncbi:MAG: CAP domain-containing protein [Bacillota bacterium]|nr:CAP domain-containing protein [Bacillota bacterium]
MINKKKAILTVAAVSALLMSGQIPNKTEAASLTPSAPERVYVYQSPNINSNEFTKVIEDYLQRMGLEKHYKLITLKQPIKAQTNHAVPTKHPSHLPVTMPAKGKPVTTKKIPTAHTASTLSAFEQQVLNLTNKERAKHGLVALKVDVPLSKMAHEKSRDMSANNYFSHTSPTYHSPFDMMKKYGISFHYAGENIAMGQRTPQEVVTAWMNSEGHRKNILDPNFTHIGVGYVAQGNYWTQDFIGK